LVENSSCKSAYWRRGVISANTIGFGEGEALQKFATLCLFVKTSLINYAVATGNGNNEVYKETTSLNFKEFLIAMQCQTKAELLSSSCSPSFFITIYL
jgi:hypothetical protein